MARVIKTVTENYTVLDDDDGGIIIGNSSSPIAITMPSSIGRATFSLTVMNANGGEVTVLSQTIGQNEEISIANSNDTWTYALGGGGGATESISYIENVDFYVDSVNGSDLNDGSISHPLQTINGEMGLIYKLNVATYGKIVNSLSINFSGEFSYEDLNLDFLGVEIKHINIIGGQLSFSRISVKNSSVSIAECSGDIEISANKSDVYISYFQGRIMIAEWTWSCFFIDESDLYFGEGPALEIYTSQCFVYGSTITGGAGVAIRVAGGGTFIDVGENTITGEIIEGYPELV